MPMCNNRCSPAAKTFAFLRVSAGKRSLETATPTVLTGRRRPIRIPRISPSATRGSANVNTVGNQNVINHGAVTVTAETVPCFIHTKFYYNKEITQLHEKRNLFVVFGASDGT